MELERVKGVCVCGGGGEGKISLSFHPSPAPIAFFVCLSLWVSSLNFGGVWEAARP